MTNCPSSSPAATPSSSMPPPSPPRRCCSAATRQPFMRAGHPVWADFTTYRAPRDLTTAQVFSDPPINIADVEKHGNKLKVFGDEVWPPGVRPKTCPTADTSLASARTMSRPSGQGQDRRNRRPRPGYRTLRLRERHSLKCRRQDLGVPVSRHPSFRGGLPGQTSCRGRPWTLLLPSGELVS